MTQPYQPYSGSDEPVGRTGPVGPAPRSTALAVNLMFLQVALSVISILTALFDEGSFETGIRNSSPDLSQSDLDTRVTTARVTVVVVGVVLIVLYVLLALQVRKGKNWARIVTVVLAALSVLSALNALAGSAPLLSKLVSLVSGVIAVALIVLLMFRPDSKAFFATR